MTAPTNRPDCEGVQALLPELALGGLRPDEAETVLGHARVCSRCRRELVGYERVVDGLLETPPPVAPSPLLRSRVMRAAGLETGSPRRTRPSLSRWLSSTFSPPTLIPRLSPVVAAIALVVALGAAYQSYQLQSDLRSVSAENRSLRSELASNRGVVADALKPGAIVWQLSGTESAPNARASLYCRPDGRSGLLSAVDLPPLPAGQAYQLWLIRDGQRTSGGLLTVDVSGNGVTSVEAPEPMGVYQGVGVTVEPATGSPGPTGQRVLSGQIYSY